MASAIALNVDLSPQVREQISVISQSGDAVLRIINDVLDLAKIESGSCSSETAEFDLGPLLRQAHSTFRSIADEKGVRFNLDIDAAEGVYLGDPTRLRQVVMNLISNALKFTHRGTVELAAQRCEGGVTIEIPDTGIGI